MTTSALSRVHLGKSVLLVLAAWLITIGIIATPGLYAATAFTITEAEWEDEKFELEFEGRGSVGATVIVQDTKTSVVLGSAKVNRRGKWELEIENPSSVPCRILAKSGGQTQERDVEDSPSGCDDVPVPATGSHVGRFSTYEGTKTCLVCHTEEAEEAHDSVHYRWRGDSSETIGLVAGDAGKLGGTNDFCIYPDINWIGKLTNVNGAKVDGGCAKCHVGLGAKPTADAVESQLENIDCLICHSDTYKRTVAESADGFRFVPDTEKMTVSILQAALDVTLPSKDSCLNCHTKAGGGNNFKRGDIEEYHRDPPRSFDVHMASQGKGGAGLSCLDCHTAVDHKIAGRGSDLRPRELPDQVACTNCHTPRHNADVAKHTARVNCTVCHIPVFAKAAATDMDRDWRQAGDLVAAKGLYEPHHAKGTDVVPKYKFFNGLSYFYQFGDPVLPEENGRVVMSAPEGRITDSGAKIHAFKRHLAYQPVEPNNGRLLPLKIGKFFETGEIQEAVELGTAAVGWEYKGHDFARTERYMGLFHEVAPKEQALACNDCHNGGTRLDFAALGYTPKAKYNGKALCTSCHEDESDEWSSSEFFAGVHDQHVDDEGFDCSKCHTFTKAN
jgi:hypothetical protein